MKRTLRAQADFKSTLLRNQLTSLVLFESVTTTKTKGLELIPFVNHFFNRIKSGDLTAKRLAHQTLFDTNAVKKVFEEILPRYQKEETTFVRSFRMVGRKGDNAPQLMVSFVRPLTLKTETKKVEDKVVGVKAEKKSAAKPKTAAKKTTGAKK